MTEPQSPETPASLHQGPDWTPAGRAAEPDESGELVSQLLRIGGIPRAPRGGG